MSTLATVLTSAAVGVLVSGILTLLGQYLERRSRRNELLLAKALEMAVQRTATMVRLAEKTGATVSLVDEVINAETYYRWLKSVLETGKLPPDADRGRRKPSQ